VRHEKKQTFLFVRQWYHVCQHRTWQSWSLPATTMEKVIHETTRQKRPEK